MHPSQPCPGGGVLRIKFESFRDQSLSLPVCSSCKIEPNLASLEDVVIGRHLARALEPDTLLFRIVDDGPERHDDSSGNFVLNGKQVRNAAVVAFRPEMGCCFRVYELGSYPHSLARPS